MNRGRSGVLQALIFPYPNPNHERAERHFSLRKMMRWSERETLHFARIYLKHEGLWNSEHPQYRVKYTREVAYKNIIKEFQAKTGIVLQTDEVKRKIKNLRSTYSQEVTKILRRSGPEATYKPTIKWFNDWHRCFKVAHKTRLNEVSNRIPFLL